MYVNRRFPTFLNIYIALHISIVTDFTVLEIMTLDGVTKNSYQMGKQGKRRKNNNHAA